MRCADRGHSTFPGITDDSRAWLPAGLEQHVLPCPAELDENHFCQGVTRADILEYLSQTYGSMFVDDLVKHLS
jgi:hypothetical protein